MVVYIVATNYQPPPDPEPPNDEPPPNDDEEEELLLRWDAAILRALSARSYAACHSLSARKSELL